MSVLIVGDATCGWSEAVVTIDGVRLDPAESLSIRRHSPTGFSWGYGGSGPAQLALAILLHVLGRRDADETWPGGDAERLYQEFKFEHLAGLRGESGPLAEFRLELDVEAWADERLAVRVAG